MPGVSFEGVTKRFAGGAIAVDDLSFEIDDGEFMILVGSSGCGKTTALRMIAGLEKPTTGTIRIGEQIVNDLSAKDRDIAMVFQNYALYPHMSVGRNLAYPLRQRRVSRAETSRRVNEVAAMLGLDALLKRRPGQLSGGQRQRVAMGRALVREPEVFLLDEPLSNLDAKLRVQMRAELKRLHARLGITTVYVTHDQVEAMTLGHRIAVISDGRLQQLGPPQEVYDAPSNVFVAGFIGSPPMNLLRGRARAGRVTAGDFSFDAGLEDADVVVGIRPECLRRASADVPGLDFQVAVVEPMGDEVVVHGSVAAELANEAATDSDAVLLASNGNGDRAAAVARLAPRDRPAEGSVIRLGVDLAEVHLFDAASGEAIPPAMSAGGLDLLVLGDCNPDLVLSAPDLEPRFGQAETIVDAAQLTIGGSGAIVACGAARLGLRAAVAGVVGDDLFGRFMAQALHEREVDIRGLVVDPDVPTGLTVILAREGDRAIITHPGTIAALTVDLISPDLLDGARHLHVASFYLQRALVPGLGGLFADARRRGMTTSVDPNWDPDERWDGGLRALLPEVDVLLPNAVEAMRIAGSPDPLQAACALSACGPLTVVKLGADGAVVARDGEEVARAAAPPVSPAEPVDTVGAGDAFDAGFLAGLLGGEAIERSLALACACGALSTRATGGTAAQPTLAEARALLA